MDDKQLQEGTKKIDISDFELMIGTEGNLDYLVLGKKGGLRVGYKPVLEVDGASIMIGSRVRFAPEKDNDVQDVVALIKEVFPDIKFAKLDNVRRRGSCFFGIESFMKIPGGQEGVKVLMRALQDGPFAETVVALSSAMIDEAQCCQYRKQLLKDYSIERYLTILEQYFGNVEIEEGNYSTDYTKMLETLHFAKEVPGGMEDSQLALAEDTTVTVEQTADGASDAVLLDAENEEVTATPSDEHKAQTEKDEKKPTEQ
jgi:hypothetical protein